MDPYSNTLGAPYSRTMLVREPDGRVEPPRLYPVLGSTVVNAPQTNLYVPQPVSYTSRKLICMNFSLNTQRTRDTSTHTSKAPWLTSLGDSLLAALSTCLLLELASRWRPRTQRHSLRCVLYCSVWCLWSVLESHQPSSHACLPAHIMC